MEPGGRVRWQATQESFLTAEKHVQTISLSSPGQYLIRDQFTGHMVASDRQTSPRKPIQVPQNPPIPLRNASN